jgi:hypothetical protein
MAAGCGATYCWQQLFMISWLSVAKKNAPDTHYTMAVGCIATDKHQLGMPSRLLVAL